MYYIFWKDFLILTTQEQDGPSPCKQVQLKIKANVTKPRWTPDKKCFMKHKNVSVVQIVTLANETIS